MARYCFYIDGFNVYHALNDKPTIPQNEPYPYRKYKWLNYRKLAESMIGPNDAIEEIYYFSAYVMWKPPQIVYRHKQYIKALRSVGVKDVMGRFKKKNVRCHKCREFYLTHEEKQTDVNIAIHLLCDAMNDIFDKAFIISADTDLMPVLKAVHQHFPEKEVGIMFPIGRNNYDLRKEADFRRKMSEQLLKNCQFPDTILVGDKIIKKPNNWQ